MRPVRRRCGASGSRASLTPTRGSSPGGERQRLALAIVVAGRQGGGEELPDALLLDEPTRGMDRARKGELAQLVQRLAGEGSAILIATHDVEFATTFAERVVLLGRGVVAADGTAEELLAGGWYFSSEVARILDGEAITAEGGAALLERSLGRSGVAGAEANR